MRPEILRHPAAELASGAADVFVERVLSRDGVVRVALSGGSTPRALYHELAKRSLPWDRIEVFWGDERGVGPDDDASNYRMASEALLRHVPIPEERIHRIEGEREDAAARYAARLGDAPLDIVLLGMGSDGHTASLFVGGADLESDETVIVARSPAPPTRRISLSLATINASDEAILLVGGESKASILARAHAEITTGRPTLPVARVSPRRRWLWIVDEAAAGQLDTKEQETG
jgi:6-phosphogluconolactonase